MAQQVVLDSEAEPSGGEVNEALVTCKKCGILVPRTMVCLYCGAPILFKNPRYNKH